MALIHTSSVAMSTYDIFACYNRQVDLFIYGQIQLDRTIICSLITLIF